MNPSSPGESGQSLVESALSLPILLLLFLGLLQLTAWGWASLLCSHAAQAAARVYCVRHADDEEAALHLAQVTAERILARAWPAAWPTLSVEPSAEGICRLDLKTVIPPLWGGRGSITHYGLLTLCRSAQIQDEATRARLQEDAFARP